MLKILLYGGSGLAVGALGVSNLLGTATPSQKTNSTVPVTNNPNPPAGLMSLKDLTGIRNVKDFGAAGDGKADDSAAIQAAIHDINDLEGGTVYFPHGRYNCSAVLLKSNLTIIGEGPGKSILSGLGGDAGMLQRDASPDAPTENITVANLEFDGSKMDRASFSTARKAITMQNVTRGLFYNLYIHNTPSTGLGIDFLNDTIIYSCVCDSCGTPGWEPGSNGFGIGTGSHSSEPVIIANCISRNTGNEGYTYEAQTTTLAGRMAFLNCLSIGDKIGFNIDGAGPVTISNCGAFESKVNGIRARTYVQQPPGDIIISNCQIGQCGGVGINIKDDAISNLTISGCRLDQINGIGILLPNSYSMIANNIISNCKGAGISVEPPQGTSSKEMVIASNIVYNNGATGSNDTDCAISLRAGAGSSIEKTVVRDNHCFDNKSTKTQRYGILLSGELSNVIVENNLVLDNIAAGIADMSDAQSDLKIRFNEGYNPVGVSSVSVSSSPFTYRAGRSGETLYIRQGQVSKITKQGVDLFTSAPATVHLEPNEEVSVTFSSAPVIVRDVH